MNWTPGFEEEFARANGYRIEPFLPALFGAIIKDKESTERFLYDYRHTISELFVNNLYREASRLCRERGLVLCSEAGGPGAPLHDVPTEDLKALGAVDVMRGEFWNGRTQQLTPDGFEELQVVKPIASAAHVYGRRIVEMEAFTSFLHWQEGPEAFKPLADRAFCEGMTRVVYHTMSHNLPEAGQPGWTYHAGTHMNTQLTWWELSGQLHAYLARCSALLMQGQFVADVAYYYGNEVPNFAKPKHVHPGLGHGYSYDDLNTEVLLQAKVDRRGHVILPCGMSYAALVLPANDRRMDLAVLQHLERLVRDGATIIGHRPERTYGLRGFPNDERQLHQIATRIWGESETSGPQERKYGRGRVIIDQPEQQVLRTMRLGPDLDVLSGAASGQIDFIHRRTEREDIYFLRNTNSTPVTFQAVFRVRSKQPELWDAVRGTMTVAAVFAEIQEGIQLPLHLDSHGSVFVVFTPAERKRSHISSVRHQGKPLFPEGAQEAPRFEISGGSDGAIRFWASAPGEYEIGLSDGSTQRVNVPAEPPAFELSGAWDVHFPAGWNVPGRVELSSLQSWTESTNAAIAAFSGIATYIKQFDLPADQIQSNERVLLDLGEVRELARVFLNGREVGLSSFAPHVLEVTGFIRPGENSLRIEVANTWLNRLIFDNALPADQRKTQTNITGPMAGKRWRDAQPKPSGLLGPVRLSFPRDVTVDQG